MEMAACAVQFNHPGSQKLFGSVRDKHGNEFRDCNHDFRGNRYLHRRKFIRCIGDCIDADEKLWSNEELYFWAEWEGYTRYTAFPGRIQLPLMPTGVHTPCFPDDKRLLGQGFLNTDPYVFGNSFNYCLCRQPTRAEQASAMARLDFGSVILFGTNYYSENAFYVDTVFVTGESMSIREAVNRKIGGSAYHYMTLGKTEVQSRVDILRLYTGKTYAEDSKCFSFVPCKTVKDCPANGFERLKLTAKEIGELSSRLQTFKKLTSDAVRTQAIWETVKATAFAQGFVLGVRFDEPELKLDVKPASVAGGCGKRKPEEEETVQ